MFFNTEKPKPKPKPKQKHIVVSKQANLEKPETPKKPEKFELSEYDLYLENLECQYILENAS